jgi:hypothetical protein
MVMEDIELTTGDCITGVAGLDTAATVPLNTKKPLTINAAATVKNTLLLKILFLKKDEMQVINNYL